MVYLSQISTFSCLPCFLKNFTSWPILNTEQCWASVVSNGTTHVSAVLILVNQLSYIPYVHLKAPGSFLLMFIIIRLRIHKLVLWFKCHFQLLLFIWFRACFEKSKRASKSIIHIYNFIWIQFNLKSSWIQNKNKEEEFIELIYLVSVISHWPVTPTSDFKYVCICIKPKFKCHIQLLLFIDT